VCTKLGLLWSRGFSAFIPVRKCVLHDSSVETASSRCQFTKQMSQIRGRVPEALAQLQGRIQDVCGHDQGHHNSGLMSTIRSLESAY
jgi:hypothetical protein